jgi:WD40 repeat protein
MATRNNGMRIVAHLIIYFCIPLLINLIASIVDINISFQLMLGLTAIFILAIFIYDNYERKQAKSQRTTENQPCNNIEPNQLIRAWTNCPTDSEIYGRANDLKKIKRLLRNHCPLIIVTGEPGIGKTALVAKIARKEAKRYKAVVWHSFLYPRSLDKSLKSWLESLGLASDGDWIEIVDRLATTFQLNPALVVLDNYETAIYNVNVEQVNRIIYFVWRLTTTMRKGSVILTSSNDLSHAPIDFQQVLINRVQLRGLNRKALCSLAREVHGLKISYDIAEKIAEKTSGNPQLARLVFDLVQTRNKDVKEAVEEIVADAQVLLESLLDRHLIGLNIKQLHLIHTLALWRRPVGEDEVAEWFPIATNTFIDSHEARSIFRFLQSTSFLRKVEGGRYSLTARILEELTTKIRKSVVDHILDKSIWFLFDDIALNHSLWPDDLRHDIRDHIFMPSRNRLIDLFRDSDEYYEKIIKSISKSGPESVFGAANHIELLRAGDDPHMSINLSGRSLRGADLQAALLFGSNLIGCDLRGVRFSDANGPLYTVSTNNAEKNLVVVGLASGAVEIRSLPRCELVAQHLNSHTQPVRWVYLAETSNTVISAGEDGRVCCWDYKTGCSKMLYRHNSWVWDGDVNDKYLITAGSDAKAIVYDLESGLVITSIKCPQDRIWCTAWIGEELLIGGEAGVLWRSNDLNKLLMGSSNHNKLIWTSLFEFNCPIKAFAICNNDVVVGMADGFIHIVNLTSNSLIQSAKVHTGVVRTLIWLNNGSIASSGDDGLIRLAENVSKNLLFKTMMSVRSRVWKLSAVPQRSSSAFVSVGDDRTVRYWDPQIADSPIGYQAGYAQGVRSVDILGSQILIGSADDLLRIVNRSKKNIRRNFLIKRHSRIKSARFINKNRMVVVLDSGEFILVEIADDTSNKTLKVNLFQGHDGAIECLGISTDRKNIVSGGEDRIAKVWDDKGNIICVFSGFHTSRIWNAQFLHDNKTIVTAGGDFTLAWWELENNSPISIGRGHTNLVFALCPLADGTIISAGSDGTIRGWLNGTQLYSISIDFTVRDICSVPEMNILVAVGRSERSTAEGWILALIYLMNHKVEEILIGPQWGGTARAVCKATHRTVVVGGDGPNLITVDLDTRRIRSLGTVSRPYEGMSLSKKSKGLNPRLCLSLETLGAIFEE